MSLITRPRQRGLLRGSAALLLAVSSAGGMGCADPPPLEAAGAAGGSGGSSVITNVGPTPRAAVGPARAVKMGVVDTGVRGGPPGAGHHYDGLSGPEKELYASALDVFKEKDTVSDGSIPGSDE